MARFPGCLLGVLISLSNPLAAKASCRLALAEPHLAEQVVPIGYQQVATVVGVPCDLLYALALTESGQSSMSNNQWRPWPWTLNIDGRGQYFQSRTQAWQHLQQALTEKHRATDVGILQINWGYHQRALGSAWEALEPYHNLQVGAAILKRCFDSRSDWWQSAGCYHAPNNSKRAEAYRLRVQRHWRQILHVPKKEGDES